MDDERVSDGQPLWPPDPPDTPTPAAPPVSEAATERIPVPQAPDAAPPSEPVPAASLVSDAPTERIPTPPAPQASDIPTHRLTTPPVAAPPASPPEAPAPPPGGWQTLAPAAPTAPVSRGRAVARWAWKHWRFLTLALAALVVIGAALGVYNYATMLAAQPRDVMARYCSALTHADYKAAYALQAPALQAQTALAQYEADSAARDAISGRVTACSSKPTKDLSTLSFLKDPRSLVYNLTLTRASAQRGQVALTRDASGWEVAALSASVVGVDLGPLHTEQALCQALVSRKYDMAYGLLSAPYQREQGSQAAFARAFGADLSITGCAPTFSGYTVDSADQRAALKVTLDVVVAGAATPTKLALPATMTLVREAAGWRVDTIIPNMSN